MSRRAIPKLTAVRKARDLSLAAVGHAVQATEAHIWRIEQGQCGVSPALADRLSKFFDGEITREQILFPEDTPAIPETQENA